MAASGVAPSTLVRSLQRFAVRECDADAIASRSGSSTTHGLVLGTASGVVGDEKAVAIWGVVKDLATSDNVVSLAPHGIQGLGSFSLWVRGDDGHADDPDAERSAAQAVAQQALAAVADKVSSPSVALVYVHGSQRLHLFSASGASIPLEIIDCLHASDFAQATERLFLRTSISFRAESKDEMLEWQAQLDDPADASNVFFQFPQRRQSVFNASGVDAAQLAAAAAANEPLSAFVKIPEKRVAAAAATTNKAKKKKGNALYVNDNWESTSKPGASGASSDGFLHPGGDGDDVVEGAASGYLKTLEYGDIADVQLLRSLEFSASSASKGAPHLGVFKAKQSLPTQRQRVLVHADALVVVSQWASLAEVVTALREELAKQLTRLAAEWTPSATTLQTHHFGLLGAAFPLSLATVDGVHIASGPSIERLVQHFVQPENQPLFEPSLCSLTTLAAQLAETDVLLNVHEGIPPSGVPNGTQYLVDGFYGYYHYMQQSMNDKGWGCAYRSLQTLASWLFWNRYTTSPTLSHRKIQETLVAIGDKPPAFTGSREWIGSMEVGFVLDELFGISFRTINAANGPQLIKKAQELKHHFETQGTPVMMGGGQLAFTLLGIDYNASSGECAFLILDPHYVGPEDLETIQTKTMALEGYKAVPCGWRKASSFSKTSFYNLCLPQRPHLE